MNELTLPELLVIKKMVDPRITLLQQFSEQKNQFAEDDAIRERVAAYVTSRKDKLSGPQLALCSALYIELSGAVSFTSRQVNVQIEAWHAKTSNISSNMETLHDRGQIIRQGEDAKGKHQSYTLSSTGRADAMRLINTLDVIEKVA
ncbi:hypothetical protein [Prosthecobacter sp.]|uniref:hypothetical protein n=1 Tax=Prosthecobacter sp. TaxID=1965333 RepID=UPI002AB81E74|nr:hypothetical protein [Prosthecobacter sp.]MDZ4405638.1 hypothetical protein [Prosthecobacter sp.]